MRVTSKQHELTQKTQKDINEEPKRVKQRERRKGPLFRWTLGFEPEPWGKTSYPTQCLPSLAQICILFQDCALRAWATKWQCSYKLSRLIALETWSNKEKLRYLGMGQSMALWSNPRVMKVALLCHLFLVKLNWVAQLLRLADPFYDFVVKNKNRAKKQRRSECRNTVAKKMEWLHYEVCEGNY